MTVDTLQDRLANIESELDELKARSNVRQSKKRGWRWFVGVFEDNPRFEEAVKVGEEWRNADRVVPVSDVRLTPDEP